MLEDEEVGDDFLQPIKSQGVYEITVQSMAIDATVSIGDARDSIAEYDVDGANDG